MLSKEIQVFNDLLKNLFCYLSKKFERGFPLKIREILELSLTEPLEQIAKNQLTIGKVAARDALKRAGCFPKNGKKGWHFEGDPDVLERSIYDFAATKKAQALKLKNKPETQVSVKEKRNKEKQQSGLESSLKKVTYEVEENLHDELKIRAIREKRNISEIVNEIFREALK